MDSKIDQINLMSFTTELYKILNNYWIFLRGMTKTAQKKTQTRHQNRLFTINPFLENNNLDGNENGLLKIGLTINKKNSVCLFLPKHAFICNNFFNSKIVCLNL